MILLILFALNAGAQTLCDASKDFIMVHKSVVASVLESSVYLTQVRPKFRVPSDEYLAIDQAAEKALRVHFQENKVTVNDDFESISVAQQFGFGAIAALQIQIDCSPQPASVKDDISKISARIRERLNEMLWRVITKIQAQSLANAIPKTETIEICLALANHIESKTHEISLKQSLGLPFEPDVSFQNSLRQAQAELCQIEN